MKQFAGKVRELSVSALLLALVFTLGLTLSGCSSDDEDTPEVSYARLVVQHELSYERSLGNDIKNIILSGYDEKGMPTFAPSEYTRTTVITKSVPLTTKNVRLAYLNSDKEIVGLYVQAVALAQGEEYLINNPAWQDVDSQTFLKSLTITPGTATINQDEFVNFDVVGTFSANGATFEQNVTNEIVWSFAEDSIVLENRGGGAFRGLLPGQVDVLATYGNVQAVANVFVLGDDGAIVHIGGINIDPVDVNTYMIPMCLDDSEHVLPKYASDYDLAPAAFQVRVETNDESAAEHIDIEVSDEKVITAEFVTTVMEDSWLLIRPVSIGDAVVTVTYHQPKEDGTVEDHLALITVSTFDAKLVALYDRDAQYLPEQVTVPRGERWQARIDGVFTDGEHVVFCDVSPICKHEIEKVDGEGETLPLVGDGYELDDETIVYAIT
ncbi:hypothetical protein IJT17_04785, partial [bacterium]|nr:hypothetical protein [bacterium]